MLTFRPVFFLCLRETLETGVIVSILLAFLKQTLGPVADSAAAYKRLRRQVSGGRTPSRQPERLF